MWQTTPGIFCSPQTSLLILFLYIKTGAQKIGDCRIYCNTKDYNQRGGGATSYIHSLIKGPIKVSFEAVAREKSVCCNSAHVCLHWTKFGHYILRVSMVQFMTSSDHGFWVTKKDKKNDDEKCASLTTLLGIIFLFFSFSQKACLNFEKKSCSFD